MKMLFTIKSLVKFYYQKYEYINSIILMIILILGICGACTYLNDKFYLKDDNAIEQFIEQKIKDKLNIDIDLSPEN